MSAAANDARRFMWVCIGPLILFLVLAFPAGIVGTTVALFGRLKPGRTGP